MYGDQWEIDTEGAGTDGQSDGNKRTDRIFCESERAENECDHGRYCENIVGSGLYRRYDWRYPISDFSIVLLSGESGTNGSAVCKSTGICRTQREGDRVGSLLWHRDDIVISGTEGKESIWNRNCTAGSGRCQKKCQDQRDSKCGISCWRG